MIGVALAIFGTLNMTAASGSRTSDAENNVCEGTDHAAIGSDARAAPGMSCLLVPENLQAVAGPVHYIYEPRAVRRDAYRAQELTAAYSPCAPAAQELGSHDTGLENLDLVLTSVNDKNISEGVGGNPEWCAEATVTRTRPSPYDGRL